MWYRRLIAVRRPYNHSFSSLSDNVNVVIAAAARTPIGALSGQLATIPAPQLAAVPIELITKQTAMPVKQLNAVILASGNVACMGQAPARQATLAANLAKDVCSTTLLGDGLQGFIVGTQMLQLNLATAVITGSMESASNVPFYMPRGQTSYGNIVLQDGLLTDVAADAVPFNNSSLEVFTSDDEIAPVRLQLRRRAPTYVTVDQITTCGHYDNASAMLLMTPEHAERLHITPLAKVLAYKQVPDIKQLNCIELRNCNITKLISTTDAWIELREHGIDKDHIALSALIPNGMAMLTQLIYALHSGERGCIIHTTASGAITILVEKLTASNMGANGSLPLFTLFTKEPCPLCDILIDELHAQFSSPEEFVLEKVFITEKENVRYLRAYRFDIPVLFLNGQFLCMHRLNVDALRRRLNAMQ